MSYHSIALVIDTNFSIYGHGPHHMIQLISFFKITEERAKSISCVINQMLFSGAVTGVLCYNTVLSLDLIVTLRNPLISGKARMKYYHIAIWVLIFLNMGYNVHKNIYHNECEMNPLNYLYQVWNYGLLTLVYILLIFSTVFSVFYIVCKKKDEINNHTKTYLFRHLMYTIVVATVWTFCVTFFWIVNDDWQLFSYNKSNFILANLIIVCGSGALQALLRN